MSTTISHRSVSTTVAGPSMNGHGVTIINGHPTSGVTPQQKLHLQALSTAPLQAELGQIPEPERRAAAMLSPLCSQYHLSEYNRLKFGPRGAPVSYLPLSLQLPNHVKELRERQSFSALRQAWWPADVPEGYGLDSSTIQHQSVSPKLGSNPATQTQQLTPASQSVSSQSQLSSVSSSLQMPTLSSPSSSTTLQEELTSAMETSLPIAWSQHPRPFMPKTSESHPINISLIIPFELLPIISAHLKPSPPHIPTVFTLSDHLLLHQLVLDVPLPNIPLPPRPLAGKPLHIVEHLPTLGPTLGFKPRTPPDETGNLSTKPTSDSSRGSIPPSSLPPMIVPADATGLNLPNPASTLTSVTLPRLGVSGAPPTDAPAVPPILSLPPRPSMVVVVGTDAEDRVHTAAVETPLPPSPLTPTLGDSIGSLQAEVMGVKGREGSRPAVPEEDLLGGRSAPPSTLVTPEAGIMLSPPSPVGTPGHSPQPPPHTVRQDVIGNLLLSSCPGKKVRLTGPVKGRGAICRDLGRDLQRMKDIGVGCVVCCLDDDELEFLGAPWNEYSEQARMRGLDVLRLPTPEGLAPLSPQALSTQLDFLIRTYTMRGVSILVHCRGGVGRAGLVACAWMLKLGLVGWAAPLPVTGDATTTSSPRQRATASSTPKNGGTTPSSPTRATSISSAAKNGPSTVTTTTAAGKVNTGNIIRRESIEMVERVVAVVRRRRSVKAVETYEQVRFLVDFVDYVRASGGA